MTPTAVKSIDTYSVAERLERLPLTAYQIKLFAIIATAFFFDCIDINMMTFALTAIKAEFSLNTVQAGLLGSASFMGMFVGASCAGLLADRFGRLKVFQWSMVLWGIASLLCAVAPSIDILMGCRILLGIGMAMEPVAGQALLCEFVPTKQRGKYMSYLVGGAPLGLIAAGLLAFFMIPIAGWRSLFLVQAVLSVFVFAIRRHLPESPRWLEEKGYMEKSQQVMAVFEEGVQKALKGQSLPEPKQLPFNQATISSKADVRDLFQSKFLKSTVMLWSLWFFSLLGLFGLITWLGALLTAKGFTMTKSNLYIAAISLAGIPGFLTLSKLVETWGRKPATIFTLIGCAIATYFYGGAANLPQVIIFGLVMQFFFYGVPCALYTYTPELYPTNLRATGCGLASAAGRVGALLGPYLIGVILPLCGQTGVFALGAVSFLIAASVTFILGKETKGKVLEEISC